MKFIWLTHICTLQIRPAVDLTGQIHINLNIAKEKVTDEEISRNLFCHKLVPYLSVTPFISGITEYLVILRYQNKLWTDNLYVPGTPRYQALSRHIQEAVSDRIISQCFFFFLIDRAALSDH